MVPEAPFRLLLSPQCCRIVSHTSVFRTHSRVQNFAFPAVLPSWLRAQLCPVVICWVLAATVRVWHGAALASPHGAQPVNPHCHLYLVLRKLRKTGKFYTKSCKRKQNPEK